MTGRRFRRPLTAVDRDVILSALSEAGLRDNALYERYSGRAMYGEECFGIVGSMGEIMSFQAELPRSLARQLARAFRTDDMGLDVIGYFPGFTIDENEEGTS